MKAHPTYDDKMLDACKLLGKVRLEDVINGSPLWSLDGDPQPIARIIPAKKHVVIAIDH